jgi:RNA polymerase sigma-54 factor
MDIKLLLSQKHTLTQRMMLSVQILQMNSIELEQFIRNETYENPSIEIEDSQSEPMPEKYDKAEWLNSTDESNRRYFTYNNDADDYDSINSIPEKADTLTSALMAQICGFRVERDTEKALLYLINSLDSNGYLPKSLKIPKENRAFTAALNILRQMEPPGVGAADLRECLSLQAGRAAASPLLNRIIDKHLNLIAENRLDKIAAILGVSLKDVKQAAQELLKFNPKPGNGYAIDCTVPYITPDIIVKHTDNSYRVMVNTDNFPQIHINEYYRNMIKDENNEIRKYVNERINKAEWLISCVEGRKRTVLRCAELLLSAQTDFLRYGPGHLAPMTHSDIASHMDVHPSTVSRAVSGKYLQCKWGVFELGYFFTRRVGENNHNLSQDGLGAVLKRLIDNENKSSPLSDQQLARELEKSGVLIARRTVSKYREGMLIPSARKRKRF